MNEVAEIISVKEKYSLLFRKHYSELCHILPGYINEIRNKAILQFQVMGIPAKKNESYKYTNLEKLFDNSFSNEFTRKNYVITHEQMFSCDIPELDAHLIQLVNGWYHNESEELSELPGGAVVGSLATAAEKYPEIVKKHLSHYADPSKNGLIALNTAFMQDGIFLYIPKGKIIEKPIQILNMIYSTEDLMINPRILIVAESGSQAKVVVCDHTLSPSNFLTNSVTEIVLEENTVFDFYKVQNEHNLAKEVSSVTIVQKRNSTFLSNYITLHGGLIRNDLNIRLDEEGCETKIYGMLFADKVQHIDNFTSIDHTKPNCTSSQLYKGIMDDFSSGAFCGKVLVRKDAQNTNATQSNNSILLSDLASAYSKPQLEIYADDVKCSHGATVGQLDENALFYLQSRGIGFNEARLLLMYAFSHEVIDKIRIEKLKESINDLLERRLRGEFSRCNHCVIQCKN